MGLEKAVANAKKSTVANISRTFDNRRSADSHTMRVSNIAGAHALSS
jgi:hypothetical protein